MKSFQYHFSNAFNYIELYIDGIRQNFVFCNPKQRSVSQVRVNRRKFGLLNNVCTLKSILNNICTITEQKRKKYITTDLTECICSHSNRVTIITLISAKEKKPNAATNKLLGAMSQCSYSEIILNKLLLICLNVLVFALKLFSGNFGVLILSTRKRSF